MNTPSRGLGRGLGALIPSSGQPAQPAGRPAGSVLLLPVSDIVPNPRQPRTVLPADGLAELAASIREHGVIQPLIVTRAEPAAGAPYQLIAGERRWRAAQLAGLTIVPALVMEATPQQHLELALVENLQRADLNPLEEAEAYHALMGDFGLSQQEVADRVGKSRVAVANSVRLLRLPDTVKALLVQGSLSEGHARALLALSDDGEISRAAEQVIARDLTVRQTEELVRRLSGAARAADETPEEEDAPDGADANVRQIEEALRAALGTKVALTRGRRGGRLVISFYSDEELHAIYERIVGERESLDG
jgi:ParB family chromosome partitioning protein